MSARSDPFSCTGQVRLKRGREASVQRRHPWVYRGALAESLPAGVGPVELLAADGSHLGVALPGGSGGSLALRMVALAGERWERGLLRRRLADAAALRARLRLDSNAYRLVHAEADRLPGAVIDSYAELAVIELFEPAWRPYLDEIAAFLVLDLGHATVLLRKGGQCDDEPLVLRGALPAGAVEIREGRQRFPVDLVAGHKTGFYLDQRDNRRRLGELASGATVLNLFSYSGGFAVSALAGGAVSAVNVDTSPAALTLAREAYRLNGLTVRDEEFVRADAFEASRELVAAGAVFGAVVVDPPSFVRRRVELAGGLRGLKEINLQALRLLAPGGLLLTCCCSALVSEETFAAMLLAAALDAGRELRVLERRGAAPDHPVSLFCPETRHLQAWFCAVA